MRNGISQLADLVNGSDQSGPNVFSRRNAINERSAGIRVAFFLMLRQ